MKRIAILTAILALSACSQGAPVDVECSVDDTLVFVALGVEYWDVTDNGILETYSPADGYLYRRMQENETCREVLP